MRKCLFLPIWICQVTEWSALDSQGNSVGGFDDPTKANVNWTPHSPGTFEISFNNLICRQTITVKQCNSKIEINKNCEHSSPVRVGDIVTYIYNITNTGDLPLKDVKVADIPEWGPECTPKYVRGDNNGDNILDPCLRHGDTNVFTGFRILLITSVYR